MVESFGTTHLGYVRQNNEDRFVIDGPFFCLADGMGGHNAGEIASALATSSMIEAIQRCPSFQSEEEACQYLLHATLEANRVIGKEASLHAHLAGMGTTLTAFLLYQDRLIYVHVGDSRLYRLRKASLDLLTKDHSLRARLAEEGDIDPTLLDMPGFKNIITKALGIQPIVMPDMGILPVQPQDLYLICSDGLTDLVSDAEIKAMLQEEGSLESKGKQLIDSALKKGGTDNITVLLIRNDL